MQSKKEDFIVILSAVPFPYGNASDNAIYTFMDGFQEHGAKGEVVCLYPNSPITHKDVGIEGEYKGVGYRYLSGHTNMPKSKLQYLMDFWINPEIKLKKYLSNLATEHRVTVLIVAYLGYRIYRYTKICHSLGIKVVMVTCEYPIFLENANGLKLRTYKFFSKYIDKYIFETKTLEDYEKSVLNRDIDSIVIPATMPFDDILECKRTENTCYIAYSGSIHSELKDGLQNIIKAFRIFHNHYTNIGLLFIGRIANRPYYKQLLELVKEQGLQEYVHFTGEVDRQEYVSKMKNAELMIVAKPKNSYYGGGLSSKVIEYLFSGNPVVMVSADDYVNYLTHKINVYFTTDNEPETLASALLEMFQNDELRMKIGISGKEYAMNNFNYHILTKELLGFILK